MSVGSSDKCIHRPLHHGGTSDIASPLGVPGALGQDEPNDLERGDKDGRVRFVGGDDVQSESDGVLALREKGRGGCAEGEVEQLKAGRAEGSEDGRSNQRSES